MSITQLLSWSTQGTRSLEEYVKEYLDIAYHSDMPDCALIDFFCDGVNQPLQNKLRREGPRSSLSSFMDYALMTVGSLFTVGVAEECDASSGRVMAAAPDDIHKMAATIITTPSQVSTDLHEPSQVTADRPEPRHVSADRPEPCHVSADRPEPCHVSADRSEPRHVSADLPESRHVSADLPESRHVSVVRPESRHVSGSVQERRALRSSVADPPLISARAAGIPKPPPAASYSSQPAATHSACVHGQDGRSRARSSW
ncbi:hypothetical protein DPX16_19016 [Anabarilius grahami]|uniref:Retrotransposon gag domain-containing protein n=1 Tax=Anabarilius grahami TaxID=495550 RepID=A0A3N0YVJ3_ANAGA|nr:hypothetical protein DPX16_19016 [Anabarilius grahami]